MPALPDDSPSAASLAAQRRRRMIDFQVEALAKPDTVDANLEAAAGGLLQLGQRLEANIEEAMAKVPEPLERMDRLRPALDSYFKALGQAERFIKLVQQRAAARQTEARLTAEYQARQQPPESQQPESHPSELHGQAPATKPR